MRLELILLLSTGTVALLGGGAVLLLGPGRLASLLAGASLLLLGLQHLGWARAFDAISWGERNYWLDLSFVCTLPVSLAWLLLSVTLGRGHGQTRFRGWRVYVPLQALAALAAVAGLHWFSPVGRSVIAGSASAVPLTSFGVWVLVIVLLNLTLMTANFEATYLSLSARWKRAFRWGLVSIVFAASCSGYVIASSVLLGRLSLWELALASVPFGVVAIALPRILIRDRLAEASVIAPLRPLYETGSFVIGVLLLGFLFTLVQLARLTGWTLVRTAWVSVLCATLAGLSVVAISSRLQRLVRTLLEPYFYTSHVDPEVVWSRLSRDLEAAATRLDVCRIVPAKTAEIAGVEPVTLFVIREGGEDYIVAGSTLDPPPSERVGWDEPLARELRASRHAIHLRGRPDDLGLIPIYVENAKQISVCEAVCAVPLNHSGKLHGFLLCGDPEHGSEAVPATLLLLEVVAQMVTTRLTSPERGE